MQSKPKCYTYSFFFCAFLSFVDCFAGHRIHTTRLFNEIENLYFMFLWFSPFVDCFAGHRIHTAPPFLEIWIRILIFLWNLFFWGMLCYFSDDIASPQRSLFYWIWKLKFCIFDTFSFWGFALLSLAATHFPAAPLSLDLKMKFVLFFTFYAGGLLMLLLGYHFLVWGAIGLWVQLLQITHCSFMAVSLFFDRATLFW